MAVTYTSEKEFEDAVVASLVDKGWKDGTLENKSEDELIENWKNILFRNNRSKDILNDVPLTDGEMRQVLDQLQSCKSPARANQFINGRTVSIVRDNPDDSAHLGKQVSLKIYDRTEIAGGDSCYQIARQPRFNIANDIFPKCRGDLTLLINGMPVFHIELKRSGVPVSEAANQIQRYLHVGAFSGLFSTTQVFVAMAPEETLYFANPGSSAAFNQEFQFHWADYNNVPMNQWNDVVEHFLSIPMAHTMVGFYTVADTSDGILKVMRSYQYYATIAIERKVNDYDWQYSEKPMGGYVAHATGSGKTMTSFKAAQLISARGQADKVLFLLDRIELSTQTFDNYTAYATGYEKINETENTDHLSKLLTSDKPDDCLIVTSIQKMGFLDGESGFIDKKALEAVSQNKRIVFIIDECHRSTFGERMAVIKQNFPNALYFGFTGTPIENENAKDGFTTGDIFGEPLHQYMLSDAITDGNVLGFDPHFVSTYSDPDLRNALICEKAMVDDALECFDDDAKLEIYNKYTYDVPMASSEGSSIEGEIKSIQYESDKHRRAVLQDIASKWKHLTRNGTFHALLATSSIIEALEYYMLSKELLPTLKVSALFDSSIDNRGNGIFKLDYTAEMIEDYNATFGTCYTMSNFANYKHDLADRLAHKGVYQSADPDQRIDLVIVVNQMLTGYDSIWLNTLFVDKMLKYEQLIQAFSRTNRKLDALKKFGNIVCYRRPHTMKLNLDEAIKLYSGDRKFSIYVDKIEDNVKAMNDALDTITRIFEDAGIDDYSRLPEDDESCAKFAKEFKNLNDHLQAALIQGYSFEQTTYDITPDIEPDSLLAKAEKDIDADGLVDSSERFACETIDCNVTQPDFEKLLQRYRDVEKRPRTSDASIPFDIDTSITNMAGDLIDANYMNSKFTKWLKGIQQHESPEVVEAALNELHGQFSLLSEEDQHFANMIISDIQMGDLQIEADVTLHDYIARYRKAKFESYYDDLVDALGVDGGMLRELIASNPTEANLNSHSRYSHLRDTIQIQKAQEYFNVKFGGPTKERIVRREADNLLRDFLLSGGFAVYEHVELPEDDEESASTFAAPDTGKAAGREASAIAAREGTKALAFQQPWAFFIMMGDKTVECRSRHIKTPVKDLVVCASKTASYMDPLPGMAYGYALALVDVVDCVPFTEEHLEDAMMQELPGPDDNAWILSNVRQIKPFPVHATASFFYVPDKIEVVSIQTKADYEKYYKDIWNTKFDESRGFTVDSFLDSMFPEN